MRLGARKCGLSVSIGTNLAHLGTEIHFAGVSDETSVICGTLAGTMKLEPRPILPQELNLIDRRIIRVDAPDAHAGITAALRRAFESAAVEPSDRDFADLLRRLN